MSTTIEQNKDIIRRFFDAWTNRQPDAFEVGDLGQHDDTQSARSPSRLRGNATKE